MPKTAIIPVFSGDHHVAQLGRQMLQEMRSERTDADPRAGRQLEVLGDASVVAEAALPISGVRPLQGIAGCAENRLRRRRRK